jgi:uncharacterized membrane protein
MFASLFPWLHAVHILFAAVWFGAAAFITCYLAPAMRQLGPAGGDSMLQALHRRGMHRFMGATAGLTVLSGLGLFWLIGAGAGAVIALGAGAGLLAAILGGAVIGRSFKRVDALLAQPEDMHGRDAGIAAAHRRIAVASRCVLALMALALLAMTLGHAF